MAKKAVKKATKIPPKRGQDKKKKLPRGYKECGSCRRLLHIHKYVYIKMNAKLVCLCPLADGEILLAESV